MRRVYVSLTLATMNFSSVRVPVWQVANDTEQENLQFLFQHQSQNIHI